MTEKFYRAKDGRIVLRAFSSVGVEHAVAVSHMHGYRDNGFPRETPSPVKSESIWNAFIKTDASKAK